MSTTDHLMIDGDHHEKVVMDWFNLLTWIPKTCESRKKSIRKAHEDRETFLLCKLPLVKYLVVQHFSGPQN
jgi:hypothetical protein